MPKAVAHVILTIVVVDIFRDYVLKNKKLIPTRYLFYAGVAGLLPDIDIPLNWLLGLLDLGSVPHGYYTHVPLLPALILVAAFFLYRFDKKKGVFAYIIAFGIAFHILLDFVVGGGFGEGVLYLFPFSKETVKLHLAYKCGISLSGVDAVILLAWLWHEQKKHRIKDYI